VRQTLDSQLEQLRAAGCRSRNIYKEKVTGARPDRRELNRMLDKLAPGDVVTVTSIDRLAPSTFDLLGIVKRIVDAKAQFRSLAEPWADTGKTRKAGHRRIIEKEIRKQAVSPTLNLSTQPPKFAQYRMRP
jgi:DNA invertase Pin-like site-specific DNA recombinase